MRRFRLAYISASLLVTCTCPAFAADDRTDSALAAGGRSPVHLPLTLVNGLSDATGGYPRPEESSGAPSSEQLRIYDAPVPVARIVIPASRPQPRRESGPSRPSRLLTYQPLIEDVAARYAIDPELIRSIAHVESGHNPRAVSPKGAQGLMQVMPGTAKRFGVSGPALSDPAVNLGVAARYLKTLQGLYGNNLPLVLAAYNAGEGAVQKYGRTIPPYSETQAYVRRVLNLYRESLAGR